MSRLSETALNVLGGCLGLRKGESVLILCDDARREPAAALNQAAIELGAEVRLIETTPGQLRGGEPPAAVAELMKRAAVLVLAASSWPSDGNLALHEATAAGARAAVMTGVDTECLIRTLDADYTKIARRGLKITSLLSSGRHVRISSPGGTDLEFQVEGRTARADTGILHRPGEWGDLPGGQVLVAPLAGTASGLIVFDPSPGRPGGGTVRLESSQNGAALLTVLGVGINDRALIDSPVLLERQKAQGAVWLDLESPGAPEGKAASTVVDCGILRTATLWLDGRLLVRDGALAV